MRAQENLKEGNVTKRELLTIHAPLHKLEKRKQVDPPNQASKMLNQSNLSNSKISKVYIQAANYENDKTVQKIIRLVINKNTAIVSRLQRPCRDKFPSFSVNEQGLLLMDNCLVIPKDMRDNIMRAIHYGHAGRDSMLREASDIWWPKIHREIVEEAQNCQDCQRAGKNLKCIKTQNEFGKLPETKEPNAELSIDFAGPFQNAQKQKKFLLISVDKNSGWPHAMFLPNPTAEK